MNVQITEKPDWISWEEITELLHQAFAEHYKKGLYYVACNQTVEDTRKRARNAICLVALLEGRLVGTILVSIYYKNNKKIGYFNQLGILEETKGHGIGTQLFGEGIKICLNNQVKEIRCDTSEKAKDVIRFHQRNGFQKIKLVSHSATNYYSVVFRYALNSRKYTHLEAFLRFFFSSLYCHCLWKADGQFTKLGKLAKSIKNKLRKK